MLQLDTQPKTLGDRLNGFGKYLPEPSAPLTPERLAEIAAEEQREQAERFRAFVKHATNDLINLSGNRFANSTLDNYKAVAPAQVEAVAALRRYIAEAQYHESGLVFFGPVGTGKDHLAVAVARAIIAIRGYAVAWVNVQDWFGRQRDRIGDDDSTTEHQEIVRLAKPRILILSEVFPPFDSLSQFQATMLYRVVEKRTASGIVTFATLNAENDKEAGRRMGQPTWDRLCDNAGKLFCNWPTYRTPAWKLGC